MAWRVGSRNWPRIIDARKAELYREAGFSDPIRKPQPNPESNPLVALGEKYRPTKRAHNYLPRYHQVFGPIRHDVRTFVEIGVQTDRSIRMWRDYFPNARIIGVDIDPACKKFEGERIEVQIGDQTDPAFLKRFAKSVGNEIDIIVDDGLHTEAAIMTSFTYLYPALGPNGIYAIEDIVNLPGIDAFLKDAVDAVQHWPRDLPETVWQALSEFDDDSGWFVRNTIGIEVYRFLAFVKRGFNPRTNPYFVSADDLFASHNRMLEEVGRAANAISAEGAKITREALVARLGFQKRHQVDWYLSGLRASSFEEWRRWNAPWRRLGRSLRSHLRKRLP